MDKVENKANAVAENVSNKLSKVTSFSLKDFLSSNSLVSKIAFTLLVMFVFFLLLKFSITLIPVLFKENNSPYIFNGTIEGNNSMIIPQDPEYDNAITIKRSVDENGGIEFSWSLWLFLDDTVLSNDNTNLHIFHKGDDKKDALTELYNIASPGLYLNGNSNELIVTMNTHNNNSNNPIDKINITDIPMNKWLNIIIRVKNKRVDVYINGTIKRAFDLKGVPKQNYGNIFIAQGSKLQGSKLSNLRYYDYALNVSDIQKMVKKGANKTLITKNAMNDNSSSYLAFDWYYN
tara:strand:- start:522 stop:1391 length:870 start_codon:yes stop_codon:yes gene_type:complete